MSAANATPVPTATARPYRPPAPMPHTRAYGSLAMMMILRRNPIEIYGIWNFEHLIGSSRSVLGHVTMVSAPEGIKHVMVDNAANYVKDRLQRRVLTPGLGDGLLTAEGEAWRRARRTLAPIFAPRSVASFTQAMRDKAQAMVARLGVQPDGARVDVTGAMTRLTFEILTATLFSDAIATSADAFAQMFTIYFDSIGKISPLDILNAPDWIPRLGKLQARPAIAFFEGQVKRIVAGRRALIASGAHVPRDLLTLLLEAADPETGQGLSEAEVGANIVTFIGAGHETTANALQWTLFLLSKHPDIRAAAEAEADAADLFPLADWLEKLPLLRAVLDESMRLYPPVASLTRSALADDEVMGHHIPKGSMVVMSPWVVHRHKKLWSEPDFFRPERFMPGKRETIDRFAYLPFGTGPRICIGQRFAQYEMVIVLATVLRSLRFAMKPGEGVVPVQRVTLRPSPRLEMLMSKRR